MEIIPVNLSLYFYCILITFTFFVQLNNKDFLVDVTTIDANNPSNGFIKNNVLARSYFPGAAAVLKATRTTKFSKYREAIASIKEFVPFVIEAQGRWGFHARELFKSIYAKIPIKGSRVSRNYLQQQISLAYMKAILCISSTSPGKTFWPSSSSGALLF